MKTKFFKITAILLMLAGCFSSCYQQEEPSKYVEREKCQVVADTLGYSFIYPQPWIYDFVEECLDSEFNGEMYTCIYRDGFGYLLEVYENADTLHRLYDCEGIVLYEGEESPINSCPELKIERRVLVFGMYFPVWKQEKLNDEFACDLINPFSFPRVKEMVLASCVGFTDYCSKTVSIFSYRNGIGFYLSWAANGTSFYHSEYLDCSGNILCTRNLITGEWIPCNDDMGIDFAWTYNQNRKYIIIFSLSNIHY